MTVKEIDSKRWATLGPKLVKSLENRGHEAFYCATISEAVEKALSLIPEKSVVGWGGSMSAVDSGLLSKLKSGNYSCLDRDTAKSGEERVEIMRKVLTCDYFITSFNAVSEDGIIVNIDGNGNRVAAITFGPKFVVALVGMNKVCKTENDALVRARTVAAVRNGQRLNLKSTGCASTGSCQNCLGPDCICNVIQTIRRSGTKNRIKIILVGEELGY